MNSDPGEMESFKPRSTAIDILTTSNALLGLLSPGDVAALKPRLGYRTLQPREQLYGSGDAIHTIYFPCHQTQVVFSVAAGPDIDVDILGIGREGAVGGFGSWGRLPSFCRVHSPLGGDVLSLPVAELGALRAISPAFDMLLARYADCLAAQIVQTAACNAAHTIEQRLARLLCAAMERAGTLDVVLTQDRIAAWLGVGRTYINRVLRHFQDQDILAIRRGRLVVRDSQALKDRSCNCSEIVSQHFALVLGGLYAAA